MKIVIVYYSLSGNTEFVAKKIAEKTGASLLAIEPEKKYPTGAVRKFIWGGHSAVMQEQPELKPYIFNPEEYDHIIIGSPNWARNVVPPIRTFVVENPGLKNKKISAFVCQSGRGEQKVFAKIKEILGIESFENEMCLIDPKDNKDKNAEEKIEIFCNGLSV